MPYQTSDMILELLQTGQKIVPNRTQAGIPTPQRDGNPAKEVFGAAGTGALQVACPGTDGLTNGRNGEKLSWGYRVPRTGTSGPGHFFTEK